MKYYVIAGEASGDLHGANLIEGLKKKDPQAELRGWGGDKMQQAGCTLVRHYKDTAIMGFLAVLKNLKKIKQNIDDCCNDILQWQPDVIILIDYAGFNLKIAKFAKKHGLNVFYYISPKIWAWNTGRVRKIKRYVDKMYVIFPFEIDFYSHYNFPVHYEGNPLMDAIAQYLETIPSDEDFRKANKLGKEPIIALVPGSRKQEIKRNLPKMLAVVNSFPDCQFVIAGAPSMSEADYAPFLKDNTIPVLYGQTYTLEKYSRAALITSGTATLEAALIGTPQVVCYDASGGAFAYYLLKKMIKVNYISLVNLMLNQEVVKELIMQFFTPENTVNELSKIVYHERIREKMFRNYDAIRMRLGKVGASQRFANQMVDDLVELQAKKQSKS